MDRDEKGRFTEGNPGKPEGTLNKVTRQQKMDIEYICGKAEDELDFLWDQLSPKEKLFMWERLQEYRRPKLSRSEVKQEYMPKLDDLSHLSYDELHKLVYGKESGDTAEAKD